MVDLSNIISPLGATAVVILIGYLLRRNGVLPAPVYAGLGAYISKVALPGAIFVVVSQTALSGIDWGLLGVLTAQKCVSMALGALLGYFSSKAAGASKSDMLKTMGVFCFFTSQSNDVAFGVPIVSNTFVGPETKGIDFTVYLFLVNVPQFMILNPILLALLESGKALSTGKDIKSTQLAKQTMVSVAKNPLVVMVVLGIAWSGSFNGHLNPFVKQFMEIIAKSFSSCALFVVGGAIASQQLQAKQAAKQQNKAESSESKSVRNAGPGMQALLPLLLTTIKLLIEPAVGLLLAAAAKLPLIQQDYAYLYGSIPTTTAVVAFAALYKSQEKVIANAMVLTILFSYPLLLTSVASVIIGPSNTVVLERVVIQLAQAFDWGTVGSGAVRIAMLCFLISSMKPFAPKSVRRDRARASQELLLQRIFETVFIVADVFFMLFDALCVDNARSGNFKEGFMVGSWFFRIWTRFLLPAFVFFMTNVTANDTASNRKILATWTVVSLILTMLVVLPFSGSRGIDGPYRCWLNFGRTQIRVDLAISVICLFLCVVAAYVASRRVAHARDTGTADDGSRASGLELVQMNQSEIRRSVSETNAPSDTETNGTPSLEEVDPCWNPLGLHLGIVAYGILGLLFSIVVCASAQDNGATNLHSTLSFIATFATTLFVNGNIMLVIPFMFTDNVGSYVAGILRDKIVSRRETEAMGENDGGRQRSITLMDQEAYIQLPAYVQKRFEQQD